MLIQPTPVSLVPILKVTSASVFGDGRYPHMPIVRFASADDYGNHSITELPDGWPIRLILGFWEAKFPKMGDFLPRTPVNQREKFDAASFIFAGEMRNHIKLQTNKQ